MAGAWPVPVPLQFCLGNHSPGPPFPHRPQGGRLHLPRGPRAQMQEGHAARPAPERRGPDVEADPAPAHQDQLRGLLLPVQRWVGRRRGGRHSQGPSYPQPARALRLTAGRQVGRQGWSGEDGVHVRTSSSSPDQLCRPTRASGCYTRAGASAAPGWEGQTVLIRCWAPEGCMGRMWRESV